EEVELDLGHDAHADPGEGEQQRHAAQHEPDRKAREEQYRQHQEHPGAGVLVEVSVQGLGHQSSNTLPTDRRWAACRASASSPKRYTRMRRRVATSESASSATPTSTKDFTTQRCGTPVSEAEPSPCSQEDRTNCQPSTSSTVQKGSASARMPITSSQPRVRGPRWSRQTSIRTCVPSRYASP